MSITTYKILRYQKYPTWQSIRKEKKSFLTITSFFVVNQCNLVVITLDINNKSNK